MTLCTLMDFPTNIYKKGEIAHHIKTHLKHPLSKRPKMDFQDQLSLHVGQKYCRMLQGEHSAIHSTYIKLPHGFKTIVFSIFEWPLKISFTVYILGSYMADFPSKFVLYL